MSAGPRIDFYVLAGEDTREWLKFACRLAEKASRQTGSIFVQLEQAELTAFDELLWTFADRSFVPHECFEDPRQWRDTPVLLGCGQGPQVPFDLLVNLGRQRPAAAGLAQRIAEVVDAQPQRRQAGRARYRDYRERGLAPSTHDIGPGAGVGAAQRRAGATDRPGSPIR